MLTAKNTDNGLPATKKFFLAAGGFRLLPECFAALLLVTCSRHSYLISVSCVVCFVWLIILLPVVEACIDKIKSPVGSLLAPFAVAVILICLLLVQMFGYEGYAPALRVIFELMFLPLFMTCIIVVTSLNKRYERLAQGDKAFEAASYAVRVVAAAVLAASYYFCRGDLALMSCVVGIVFGVVSLLEYLAVFGYVPRLAGCEKKTFAGYVLPHIEMIDRRHIFSTVEVVTLVGALVLAANVAVFYLSGTSLYWINSLILVVYGVGRVFLPKLLADYMNYKASFTYVTAISLLFGVMLAGVAVLLPGTAVMLTVTGGAVSLLVVVSLVFRALAARKASREILEESIDKDIRS